VAAGVPVAEAARQKGISPRYSLRRLLAEGQAPA
jgi:hypothetical protein